MTVKEFDDVNLDMRKCILCYYFELILKRGERADTKVGVCSNKESVWHNMQTGQDYTCAKFKHWLPLTIEKREELKNPKRKTRRIYLCP